MNFNSKNYKPGNQGFSLIELLVVLVILGVLGMVVVPRFLPKIDEAKIQETKTQIQALETALEMYKIDAGRFPTTSQGLKALIQKPDTSPEPKKYQEGGYLKKQKVPTDGWGNDFVYISPGAHGAFDITSYGQDSQPGGDGNGKDINNWDTE